MKILKNLKKIRSHASSSQNHDSFGEESLRINEYYQPPLGELEEIEENKRG